MASKIKSSFNFSLGASKQTTTTTTTTTAAGQQKKTTATTSTCAAKQAVLSINVNQEMAPTFDNQCMIQQQQAKKKRMAFENLTNANGSSQSNIPVAVQCVANNANKDSKKSRTNNPVNYVQPAKPALKKADSFNAKKPTLSLKAGSKENLNANLPAAARKASDAKATSKPVGAAKPQPLAESKLSKSANSVLTITKMESSEAAQILEPTMKYADSTEKLTGSQNSLNNIDLNHSMSVKEEETAASSFTAQMVEGWEDIDMEDKDEFSCSDYVAHIFKYYREREEKFVVDDYLKRQPAINRQMRLLLVDWMVEVQQQLEFNHEVLYLSVKLLDLYLNKRRIEKEKLQLLGGAAMFIACKFEERMPPIIDDFIYVSDNAYDRNELIKMEIDILKTVKFDIGIPLSYTFLRRYSKCVKADMRFLTLARYILELSLQDYSFAYTRDSDKACAALYLALKMTVAYENNIKNLIETNPDYMPLEQLTVSSANLTATEWNPTLIHYTGAFLSDFVDLLPGMNNLIKTAALSKYKTIFKKYSHQVFYEVAKIAPLSDQDIETLIRNADSQRFLVHKTN